MNEVISPFFVIPFFCYWQSCLYNNDKNNDERSLPVTVIVKRIAKKDRIKEFEEWVSGISKEMSKQEGTMGTEIIRPVDKESKPEYVIIFRFNNYDNLRK